jgi:hypothetical protein
MFLFLMSLVVCSWRQRKISLAKAQAEKLSSAKELEANPEEYSKSSKDFSLEDSKNNESDDDDDGFAPEPIQKSLERPRKEGYTIKGEDAIFDIEEAKLTRPRGLGSSGGKAALTSARNQTPKDIAFTPTPSRIVPKIVISAEQRALSVKASKFIRSSASSESSAASIFGTATTVSMDSMNFIRDTGFGALVPNASPRKGSKISQNSGFPSGWDTTIFSQPHFQANSALGPLPKASDVTSPKRSATKSPSIKSKSHVIGTTL